MATIWTFGDSLTERYNSNESWAKKYIDWKGYLPKVYGNFIAETLNYDLQNLGKAGCDNYTIFETFCKTYSKIKDGDIVIIGWTNVSRFRLVNRYDEWNTINPHFDTPMDNFEHISKNTLDEILINRDSKHYINEVNNWIQFINSASVNKNVVHWNTIKGKGELNTHHFFEMERINTETKGLIDDAHFSETGQRDLALELIKIISAGGGGGYTNKLI
jgi:lysophospholipase L1-like esterase